MRGSPAFQTYPQEFLSDLNVKMMSTEAVGAYWLLICHEWIECGLPDDDEVLAVLSGMGDRWPEVKDQVRKCFVNRCSTGVHECSTGVQKRGSLIVHPRLEKERKKQEEYRKQKSAAGRASGNARRRKGL